MIVFTFSTLVSPWVLAHLGAKVSCSGSLRTLYPLQKTLLLGSLTFTTFLLSFMAVHFIPFYFTAALLGIGFAREIYVSFDLLRSIDPFSLLFWLYPLPSATLYEADYGEEHFYRVEYPDLLVVLPVMVPVWKSLPVWSWEA